MLRIAMLLLAVPAVALAQKVWTPTDLMLDMAVCPSSGSALVTVEGMVDGPFVEDGWLTFDLLDGPDDNAIIALVVYAKPGPNLRDGMRVRVTGPCSRKGSADNAFPGIRADRLEVR